MTDDQRFKASEMFGIAVSMASALSRDNLDQFTQQVASLQNALLPFHHAFADEAVLKKQLAKLEATAHLQPAADLAAARKAFLTFSNALVDFAKVVRQVEAFSYLRIYHCQWPLMPCPVARKTASGCRQVHLCAIHFWRRDARVRVEVNVSNVVKSANKASLGAQPVSEARAFACAATPVFVAA